LEQGGFARVYEMTDLSSNITYACKIVKKASLVQERIKLKVCCSCVRNTALVPCRATSSLTH